MSGGDETLARSLHDSLGERTAPVRAACDGQLAAAQALRGCKVSNRQGDTLGEVDSVLLDLPRGRIAAVVMASGGFLGVGQRLYPLPWTALALDSPGNALVLDAQKEAFDHAPVLDAEHWPEQSTTRVWHDALHRHWGARPYWD